MQREVEVRLVPNPLLAAIVVFTVIFSFFTICSLIAFAYRAFETF